jgi:hypothetical protein
LTQRGVLGGVPGLGLTPVLSAGSWWTGGSAMCLSSMA